MVRIIEANQSPVGWRGMPGGLHENGEVAVSHLVNGHFKSIYPDAMRGALLITALLTTHQEIPGGNQNADRFDGHLGHWIAAAGARLVRQWNHGADSAGQMSEGRSQESEVTVSLTPDTWHLLRSYSAW
jgi:hypothetical protein